ncbi:MAG: GNAT family N-acetyltransferase [Patescibacteria group bacterium]
MIIRRAIIGDLSALQSLFVETIRNTCKEDYNEEQIECWASSVKNRNRWEEKLTKQYFLVAQSDNEILGFASLEDGNTLDLMYVSKDHLRKGVATKLYEEIEMEARKQGSVFLVSDVSITAKPFFQNLGFSLLKENQNLIEGIEINNYKMRKELE